MVARALGHPLALGLFLSGFVEKSIRQQGQDPPDAALVLDIRFAALGLLAGRVEQLPQPVVFLGASLGGKRMPVGQLQPRHRPIGSLDRLLHPRLFAGVAFNPIPPVAMRVVIVNFVIDHFANQIGGIRRRSPHRTGSRAGIRRCHGRPSRSQP